MALVINTNIASLNAQRNLAINSLALDVSVQRLSSGLRINSAKDDAAGLAISEKLRAHVRSINVAVRNSQDGISLSQTAEGALSEIGSLLARMRELTAQAANGSISASNRTDLDNEFQQLKTEIDRIVTVTEFNGTKLIDGSQCATGITLQVGFLGTTDDRMTILSGLTSVHSGSALALTGNYSAILSAAQATSVLAAIDSAISTVATRRGTLGATQNRLDSTISNLRVASENLTAADSRIRDADFAHETAQFTRNQILVQAATAILTQANVLPQAALQLLK
ncbi:MAG: flagellin FliC [Desulfobacterales bacterium]|nr:flagellin FliC [Desulfobacterales bacterium]